MSEASGGNVRPSETCLRALSDAYDIERKEPEERFSIVFHIRSAHLTSSVFGDESNRP